MKSAKGMRPAVWSALALAFAGLGDAFLYAWLPVNGPALGLSAVATGAILAVNRFVRLVLNGLVVRIFGYFGIREVTIALTALAIVSTSGYALAASVPVWIILRLLWGGAYAGLRTAASCYALDAQRPGFALGVSRSLQECGPVLALLTVPLLVQLPHDTMFLVLGAISLPALYFSVSLPARYVSAQRSALIALTRPSSFNLLTFLAAFIIDGMLIICLGSLLIRSEGFSIASATTVAAFYLAYRRTSQLIFSPVGGWLADRLGVRDTFMVAIGFCVAGLVLLSAGLVHAGLVIIFTFNGIHIALGPAVEENDLRGIAENATWRDLGAASGTLLGGFVLDRPDMPVIVFFFSFVMFTIVLYYRFSQKEVSWKWLRKFIKV